ncbi:MAG: ATP-dependent RNA helicase HrpA [Vitreoscilla sp.]|nr:ATP-dependent RNA helicase HrpA [Vitreoscilla sp.]MBP9539427.1 ATP-dependent RNA helicase HrpA [Vitreoscilla sp.]
MSFDIKQTLSRDRHYLQQALKRPEKFGGLDAVQQKYQRSHERYLTRLGTLPTPTYSGDLPVHEKLADLKHAIAQHQVVIIAGETGSGKTTQIPKICLELGRGVAGLIGHTQPRRLAARAVAERIAEELGSDIGEAVGYKVRFNDKTRPESHIKLMTDGIMLAETQTDRYLSQYDTIIIDEAHERSLNIDFLLGYLKNLLPRRPDLKIIITSATIDSNRFAEHFAHNGKPAPVIEVSGRTFPIEMRYRPLGDEANEDEEDVTMMDGIVDAVDELCLLGDGDILVFLAGEKDIREAAEALRKGNRRNLDILPLFARLSAQEQHRIFHPTSQTRRVILATNIAETSLTVPGIRFVIDTGLARVKRYSARAKVEQLHIEKISQAAARQRAGRCGRVAAGVAIRLYAEDDFNTRSEYTDPEILRSNLAAVILRMVSLQLGDVAAFPFLQAPEQRYINDGFQVLLELGAVDDNNHLTKLGEQMAKLPVDPKIARMLLAAKRLNCVPEILIIVSALSIQDPRERPFEARDAADKMHERFKDKESDFLSYLYLWEFFLQTRAQKSYKQTMQVLQQHFLSGPRMREWRELHQQLEQTARELELLLNTGAANESVSSVETNKPNAKFQKSEHAVDDKTVNKMRQHGGTETSYDQIHRALLTGLIAQVGLKAPDSHEYQGARGSRFHLFPASNLFKAKPKWVMAAELMETTKLYARDVAKINPEWIELEAPHLVKKHYFEPHWSKERGEVLASERVTLYGLTVMPRRLVSYGRIAPEEARELFIRGALVEQQAHFQDAFFKHNAKLIKDITELEHKSRKQDVLVDDEVLFDFYQQRIDVSYAQGKKTYPIVDAATFHAWLKLQADDKALYLSRDDLMQHSATHITDAQFPKTFKTADGAFKLTYRFEPHHPLDGVTMTVPLPVLNRLDDKQLEWLVAGLIREKLQLLIKALPKQVRRVCVPVPDFVTRFLEREPNQHEPILPQLAAFIAREFGDVRILEQIDFDAWAAAELPAHCFFNFRVIDDGGQELAMGRNLLALQQQLGHAAAVTFSDNANEFEQENVTTWSIGKLPDSIKFARGKQQLTGYLGLQIQSDGSIALKLFDTQGAADEAHYHGVIALMAKQLKDQIKDLNKGLASFTQVAMLLKHLGVDALREDITRAVCQRAFIGDDDLPRNDKDFKEQIKRARSRLPAVKEALNKYLLEVAQEYAPLVLRLQKHPLKQVLQQQLQDLIHTGFASDTPWSQWPHLARYLKGMNLRMDKYSGNPARDAQREADIQVLQQQWQQRISDLQRSHQDIATDLKLFRWGIEELRVSLFAQELKTPYPVSVKRLQKQWTELTRVV